MFDLSWSEILIIGVVALIAIGPKELPGVLRSVGHWMGKIRRMASEFQGQFQEAMREAEMADLKKHADDLNDAAKKLTSNLDPTSLDSYGSSKEQPSSSTSGTTDGSGTPALESEPSAGALTAEGTGPGRPALDLEPGQPGYRPPEDVKTDDAPVVAAMPEQPLPDAATPEPSRADKTNPEAPHANKSAPAATPEPGGTAPEPSPEPPQPVRREA